MNTEPQSRLPSLDRPPMAGPASPNGQLPARMRYRTRPVSVAVDPISLVISECIAITSAIQKYARSSHSSVSAILGGGPSTVQLGAPSPALRKAALAGGSASDVPENRWGLRGKKGKSMQDNPLIAAFARLRYELAGIKGEQPKQPRARISRRWASEGLGRG